MRENKVSILKRTLFLFSFLVLCLGMGITAEAKVKINKTKVSIYEGKSVRLKVTGTKKKVKWTSSNDWVASVRNGKVTGRYPGKATIKASVGQKKLKCKVTVKACILELNTYGEDLLIGESTTVTAYTKPASKVKWTSEDTGIATVKNGKIKAKEPGSTTITAEANGHYVSFYVDVKPKNYYFQTKKQTIFVGEEADIRMLCDDAVLSCETGTAIADGLITLENDDTDEVSITGRKEGSFTLTTTASYGVQHHKDWIWKTSVDTQRITIIQEGIDLQNLRYGVGKKGIVLHYKKVNEEGQVITPTVRSITWRSSNPAMAAISSTGGLTFLKAGTVKIYATVTMQTEHSDSDIENEGDTEDATETPEYVTRTFETEVTVTNPILSAKTASMAVSTEKRLKVTGTNSKVSFTSSNSSVASVDDYGNITACKKGSARLYATVDGIKIGPCTIAVSNPSLPNAIQEGILLSKGKTSQIKLKGLSAKSKVKYSSNKKSVATVSKSGKVKAKKKGNAYITVWVDGASMDVYVGVADKRAVAAVKQAKKIISKSTYSQPKRMQQGFYDCSSLVWRSYQYTNSGYLLGNTSYAPTAAAQAEYMARSKKVLSMGYLDESKLLPGDLLFFGGYEQAEAYHAVGRYLNIYHVSMYAGNGLRVEKPFMSYYDTGDIIMIARPTK